MDLEVVEGEGNSRTYYVGKGKKSSEEIPGITSFKVKKIGSEDLTGVTSITYTTNLSSEPVAATYDYDSTELVVNFSYNPAEGLKYYKYKITAPAEGGSGTTDYYLILYTDIAEYLANIYGLDKTTLKVKVIKNDDDNYAQYVVYDGDKIVINQIPAGGTNFKVVIYYTYTDDCPDGAEESSSSTIISEEKEVDVFVINYSRSIEVLPKPE